MTTWQDTLVPQIWAHPGYKGCFPTTVSPDCCTCYLQIVATWWCGENSEYLRGLSEAKYIICTLNDISTKYFGFSWVEFVCNLNPASRALRFSIYRNRTSIAMNMVFHQIVWFPCAQ